MTVTDRVVLCARAIACAGLAACGRGGTPDELGPGSEDDSLLGVDFVLDYAASGYNPRRADLFGCSTNDPGGCRSVATPSVSLTSEGFEWRFPTSALQDADGLMRVKVIAFVGDFPGETSADADVVPARRTPGCRIQVYRVGPATVQHVGAKAR